MLPVTTTMIPLLTTELTTQERVVTTENQQTVLPISSTTATDDGQVPPLTIVETAEGIPATTEAQTVSSSMASTNLTISTSARGNYFQ